MRCERTGSGIGQAYLPATISSRSDRPADLERSIGGRLAALTGAPDRIVSAAEIDTILDAIGTGDAGVEPPPAEDAPRPKRKLQRIRKGQEIEGVCNGIAEYSQIGVDWARRCSCSRPW